MSNNDFRAGESGGKVLFKAVEANAKGEDLAADAVGGGLIVGVPAMIVVAIFGGVAVTFATVLGVGAIFGGLGAAAGWLSGDEKRTAREEDEREKNK